MRIYWSVLALTCFTISLDAPGIDVPDPVVSGVGADGEVCVQNHGLNPEMVAKSYFKQRHAELALREVSGRDEYQEDEAVRYIVETEYAVFQSRRLAIIRREKHGKEYVCAYFDEHP